MFKKIFFVSCISLFLLNACKTASDVSSSSATITALNCSSAVFANTANASAAYTSTASVPYTGGNGVAFSAGSSISSTGVTGLTATLAAGTLSSGVGNLTYSITGTPSAAGTAAFALSFGGQSCSLSLSVGSGSTTNNDCSSQTGVAQIVCLAEAFKATLSASQIALMQLDYNFNNIKTWSNLPAAMAARKGIAFSALNATQLAAAKALVKAMTNSNVANEGYEEVQQVWAADDWLVSDGKANSDYGSGNYYIAFFGTPSTTGTFEIMETGHHKTVANTYSGGALVAATPHFEAVEPVSWTSGSILYAPISQERDAFVALLAGLSSSQVSTAKSNSTFTDLLLTPGKEWSFPITFTGLKCSGLTDSQKTLVLNVIKTYTNDIDAVGAAKFLATYTNDLDNTYVTYSGTVNINTQGDYFRIDGPHVWIEFYVAGGIIYKNSVHFHSVWRDRVSDYNGTKS